MTTNRRTLIQGAGVAAMLAPLLAAERAAAATPAPKKMADDAHHMKRMADVLGPRFEGKEQIAMMLYPGFTALDFVGPHFFFGSLSGATVHLVTTESDLTPVKSDAGLAIAPTITMHDVPKDLDVLFVGGGTTGTMDVMRRKDVLAFFADRGARARYITSV